MHKWQVQEFVQNFEAVKHRQSLQESKYRVVHWMCKLKQAKLSFPLPVPTNRCTVATYETATRIRRFLLEEVGKFHRKISVVHLASKFIT